MATVNITDVLVIEVDVRSRYSINVTTGALVVDYTVGSVTNPMAFTEPSELRAIGGSVLTFTLNGDTANITRI